MLIGGIIIAIGHFTLVFHALPFFYAGLAFIAVGTGLLKPNVSGIVGSLYDTNDPRRDAGFSIFYMGINLGAALGPLVAGLSRAAGGLARWLRVRRRRDDARPHSIHSRDAGTCSRPSTGSRASAARSARRAAPVDAQQPRLPTGRHVRGLHRLEWKRLAAMAVFFVFAAIFWGAYEQAGSTLNLFGDRYTRTTILGFNFPSSWFVSVQAVLVILLAPAFAWLWTTLGKHEPSTPAKFAIGLFFVGLSFVLLLVPAFRLQAITRDSREPVLARRLLLHSRAR